MASFLSGWTWFPQQLHNWMPVLLPKALKGKGGCKVRSKAGSVTCQLLTLQGLLTFLPSRKLEVIPSQHWLKYARHGVSALQCWNLPIKERKRRMSRLPDVRRTERDDDRGWIRIIRICVVNKNTLHVLLWFPYQQPCQVRMLTYLRRLLVHWHLSLLKNYGIIL